MSSTCLRCEVRDANPELSVRSCNWCAAHVGGFIEKLKSDQVIAQSALQMQTRSAATALESDALRLASAMLEATLSALRAVASDSSDLEKARSLISEAIENLKK